METSAFNPYAYIDDHTDQATRQTAKNIRRFIEAINEYAGGWVGLSRCAHNETPFTAWAQGNDVMALTQMSIHAAKMNVREGWGVHLNVCPRKGRPAGGRGLDSAVLCYPCLWVDIDGHDGSALDSLTNFNPHPSIVVASGGQYHYHAYWCLWYPVPYSDTVARINEQLAVVLHGDSANGRPSSMIRVPGTRNVKPGRDTTSQVVYWDMDKLYTLDRFVWLDPGPEIARPRTARVAVDNPTHETITAEQVAMMCHNVKHYRDGWKVSCPCPGHGKGQGDSTPSMTVRQGDKCVLIKCFGGCEVQDIARALGIPLGALHSEDSRPATRAEMRKLWQQERYSDDSR